MISAHGEHLDLEAAEAAIKATRYSRGPLREFIVDVLGSLVPGTAFLVAALPAFVLPMAAAVLALLPASKWPLPHFEGGVPASIGTIVFILLPALLAFLTFGYIAGHLFFRQDPKRADTASFRTTLRSKVADGMVRMDSPSAGTSAAKKKGELPPVEFPYRDLKTYLKDRGLLYLAELVPWDGTEDTESRRTKHFINALKIRIHLECPPLAELLARTEAHVRLSSSMWYVCGVLLWMSGIGAVVYGAAITATNMVAALPDVHLGPIIALPGLTFVTAFLAMTGIERSLHYQREREVLFILESAYWLRQSKRVPNCLEGLVP